MKLRYGFKGAGNEGVDVLKFYYSDRAEAKYGFCFNRVENFFECIIGKTKSAKFLNQKCKKNLTCIVSF